MLRWIGIIVGTVVGLLAIILAAAPTILSTAWGQELCLRAASRLYPGTIELQSLSMGWWSGIEIQGLRIKDPEERELFSCARCRLDTPLIVLLFSRSNFGSLQLVEPQLSSYASQQKDLTETPHARSGSGSHTSGTSIKTERSKKHDRAGRSTHRSSSILDTVSTPNLTGSIQISGGGIVAVGRDNVVGRLSDVEASIDLNLLHASHGSVSAALSHNSSSKKTPIVLDFTTEGAPELQNIQGSFSFTCTNVPTDVLAAIAQSLHPNIADILHESFGKTVSYVLSATATGSAISMHSALSSGNVQSTIDMKFENNLLTVDTGTLLSGTLTPRLFQVLTSDVSPVSLLAPTSFSIENRAPLSFHPTSFEVVSLLDLQGNTLTPLSVAFNRTNTPLNLSLRTSLQGASGGAPEAVVQVTATSAAHTANLQLVASGAKTSDGYRLSTLTNLDGQWPAITEEITGLPCVSLIGSWLTGAMQAKIALKKHDVQGFAITVSTADLTTSWMKAQIRDASFCTREWYDKSFLPPQSDFISVNLVEATLSPMAVNAIKTVMKIQTDITTDNDVTVAVRIPRWHAHMTSFFSKDRDFSIWKLLDTTTGYAEASTSPLSLRNKERSLGLIPPLSATCDVQGEKRAVSFSLSSPEPAQDDGVRIAIQGSCDNFWNADGVSLPTSSFRSTIDIERFPSLILDVVFPQQGVLLEEAIGKTIRILSYVSIEGMKSGSVQCDVQAKNLSMHIDGSVQNGMLTLKTPATAALTITNTAGALLLHNVNPLLATAARSEKPLRLTIDPHGAQIPLWPFSLTTMTLPKVTADIGKITVRNGGALQIILALLNMGQAANSEELELWFTPVYMNLNRGVITCQRTDTLVANAIHMITWGDIDLGKDRIDMVIAIPQESLSALRLQIITPTPERGLQIPITGAASRPKIDTARATARLAGAALVDNVPDPRLQIFGGILQAAAATMGEPDQPIPPPTTQPFPWERR